MTTPAVLTPTAPLPTTTDLDDIAPAAFPDFPPRADMMNTENLHDDGIQAALRLYLGNSDTTVVLGEVPLYWRVTARRRGVRIPDLMIAFHIRRAQISRQKGYGIEQQGKPPDFVLEVASDTTADHDQTGKWQDYADFGVTEYWLYDPDWGKRYRAGLMGWRLVNGRYQAIPIHQARPGRYYGWSAALGLYVCWEHGKLRFYDPITGYLRTHDEEHYGRIAEHDGRIAERNARRAEYNARIAERTARIAEYNARIAAEAQRDAAQSEVERLRAEIARLRAETDRA